ncbi:MAG: isochorismatase [Chloroflexota bacterium]
MLQTMRELPLPAHFDPGKVGEVRRVPYQELAEQAAHWARLHHLQPAAEDEFKTALIIIDVQNTFCIPGFELFVGGRSGDGAVEDNRRLCEFIYRNLAHLTQITATLDTHTAMQIFHPIFLVDAAGEHPAPMTLVSYDDLQQGKWRFNPAIADSLSIEPAYGQEHLLHYAQELRQRGKYDLTIWPYHVMLGSIGHALVAAVEEALFFHTIARASQADFEVKGSHPLTEHYSALGPEVLDGPFGEAIAVKNGKFIQKLRDFNRVIIAGQAKSHCVAWTIADLLSDLRAFDESLVKKVYLLEDCTSPVVVPGVVDYTDMAESAFQKFAEAGMHIVRSTEPMAAWPG